VRFASAHSEVTIGYQLIYNPWKVAIANGDIERSVDRPVSWRKFESGAKVVNTMILGKVQIAPAGSSPIAAAISQGLDIEVVWIFGDIAAAEALVVRNGSGIVAPGDLRGKTIGVPFASTTHFHLLFALDQFGITPDEVTIRNMQPQEIADAWPRGEIDATFVWDPVLGEIKKTGKVLWDRSNPSSWTPTSPAVEAIVSLSGGDPANVPIVLDLYDFPTLEEQASPRWLGGGSEGGVAKALAFTAEFLRQQGKIRNVVEDFSRHVNPQYVEMALAGKC